MSLWIQVLLATLITIAAYGIKKDEKKILTNYLSSVQRITPEFTNFVLYPSSSLSSSSSTSSVSASLDSSATVSSSDLDSKDNKCNSLLSVTSSIQNDYCIENGDNDPVKLETNTNNKVSRNFLLTLGRLDYDIQDNTKKNHKKLIQFLINEMRSSNEKRSRDNVVSSDCDCQIKNDVIDLGFAHFPRYLINAVCHENDKFGNLIHKCRRGAKCKPIEYRVRVLTHRTKLDILENDHTASLLPNSLRPYWKFKTVTVTTGCFCSF